MSGIATIRVQVIKVGMVMNMGAIVARTQGLASLVRCEKLTHGRSSMQSAVNIFRQAGRNALHSHEVLHTGLAHAAHAAKALQ